MKFNQGFTLIEVMIGILVFSVGILGVVSMQTTSIAANAKAQHTSAGSALASSMLAGLRPLDYNDDQSLVDGDHTPLSDEMQDANALYQVKYTVNLLDSGPQDPLGGEVKLISMEVTWDDYGTQHKSTFHYFKQDELR